MGGIVLLSNDISWESKETVCGPGLLVDTIDNDITVSDDSDSLVLDSRSNLTQSQWQVSKDVHLAGLDGSVESSNLIGERILDGGSAVHSRQVDLSTDKQFKVTI